MAGSATGYDFGSDLPSRELTWPEARPHSEHDYATDIALAAALKQGEDAAYQQLLARFEDLLYNLVFRLLHNPADAEDVTQEVFLKVFRSIGSFRGESSLKTWVYRIAVNEARNHLRKCTRRFGNEVGLDDEATPGMTWEQVLEDRHGSPFDSTCTGETREAIEAALRRVREPFREALVLCDVEELSYSEIAAILGENLATVKTRIFRGRRTLRKLLQEVAPAGAAVASSAPPRLAQLGGCVE
jgi:RNA polymerase sigma-70 factor (ECF subfamily)